MNKTSDVKNQINILENFFFNSQIEINYSNFFLAIMFSIVLAFLIKLTYIRVSRTLSDRDYFSDTFIPLAIITALVITVIKFSLALSLGLVGALSIVRFRAAIKEPEELVFLFFIIAIGLANGANQFLLAIVSTIAIIAFLLIKNIISERTSKYKSLYESNVNILNIELDNPKDDEINKILERIKPYLRSLKLKSANLEKNFGSYIFWYDVDNINIKKFLNEIQKISKEDINISIYSKTGVYE